MPTYKSTVKLTPNFHYENRSSILNYIIALFTLAALFCCFILYSGNVIPRRHTPEYDELQARLWLAAVIAAIVIPVFTSLRYRLNPLIRRTRAQLQCRRCKKLYGTPAPTLETYLKGDIIVTRVIETDRQYSFPLHKATVDITDNYIIVRTKGHRLSPFAKADFTEDELKALLSALQNAGCDIYPKS